MSDLGTARVVAATVYFVSAIAYGTMVWIVWTHLRAGWRRGWLSHAFVALNRLAIFYYIAALLAELTPTEFQGRVPGLHTGLLVLGNLVAVAMGPLFRHIVPYLAVAGSPASRRWLARNYGSAVPGAVVAVLPLWAPAVSPLGALLAVHLYLFGMVLLGIRDMRRLETAGVWPARHQPDVVIGSAIMAIGLTCTLLGGTSLAVALARGAEPSPACLPLLRSGVGLTTVAPFAVRILELVFRRLIVLVAMMTAAALFFGMHALAGHVADPETRRLLTLLAVWWIVMVLVPGQAWLRDVVDRVVLGRRRRHQDELLAALHELSPELGVTECCRRALAELAQVMQLRGAAIALADDVMGHGDLPVEPIRRVWPADVEALPARTFAPRDVDDARLTRTLLDEGVLLVVPLASRRRRRGHLLIVPGRLLGTLLSGEDVDTVEAFAGELALVLDGAELLERAVAVERTLAHAEKLAAIGELAARVAHEIRNPVTAARSLAQQLAREAGSPWVEEHALILAALERVERQVSELLRFARREEFHFAAVDLAELVTTTLEEYRPRLEATGVELQLDANGGVPARADRDKLRQVLVNLFDNALDALASADGARRLRVAVQGGLATALLRVTDTGPGVPSEALPHLFEPFFSLKEQGTGLGLAIVKRTIDAHGGRITAAAGPDRGMTFEIELPLARGG